MEEAFEEGDVRGILHTPEAPGGDGLVLTHGAGSNCRAPLITALARAFAGAGFVVLRCDLPFRQQRPHGPPFPAVAARDRAGLRSAAGFLRRQVRGRVFLGGHSYGGRQSAMLAAEDPSVAAGLLLLSYPLHPPRKPEELRTAHFSTLRTPALFVQGTHDPFGSIAELQAAIALISARTDLMEVPGAGHELKGVLSACDDVVRRLRGVV